MSTFLDDLERELLAAHPRRRAARRRATAGRALRAAPVALLLLVAGAFVVTVGGEDASRPVSDTPPREDFAPDLPEEPVAVLNGSTRTGLARMVADALGVAGPGRPRDELGNAPPPQVRRTLVEYAPGHEDVALRMGNRLGAVVRPITPGVRAATGDAAVAVVAGSEIRRVRSGTLRPPGERGAAHGSAAIVDRGRDSRVSVDAVVPAGGRYGVWIVLASRSTDVRPGRALFVGFAEKSGSARLRGVRRMSPRVTETASSVVVSREPSDVVGRRPADPVLLARLR